MNFEKSIPGKNEMDRRSFFTKSVGWSAGLTLLAYPGLNRQVMATQGQKSKEEILKELADKTDDLMPKLRSCALASFAALNQQFNLNADPKILPALMPFTGGIALKGETCGAVSGSMLAIGYFFESMGKKEMAGSSIQHGGTFFDQFTEAYGSTRCRDIQVKLYGRYYDFLNPEEQKQFMEISQKTPNCFDVVKKAVQIAGEIILTAS
jgi:C_GCAxxG_C_C family probable redox protein